MGLSIQIRNIYNSQWQLIIIQSPCIKDHPYLTNTLSVHTLLHFRLLKDNYMPEPHLVMLDAKNDIIWNKGRITNHRLPIQPGRWQNLERKTIWNDSSATKMTLEMNSIIFCNAHTLSKTVNTSSHSEKKPRSQKAARGKNKTKQADD